MDGGGERSDEDLLGRTGLGDHEAFGLLVDRHGGELYRYARRVLGSHVDAQDAVQDALTAAWFSAGSFRGEATARAWLFGVQANCVRRLARRRSAARTYPVGGGEDVLGDRPTGAWGDPPAHAAATDLRAALDAALRRLPDPQRAAWLLVHVDRLSYADAASRLGTTPAAVRGLLERARRTLVQTFGPWR